MNHDLFEITGDLDEIIRHAKVINHILEQSVNDDKIDWGLVERHASELQDHANGLYDGVAEDE